MQIVFFDLHLREGQRQEKSPRPQREFELYTATPATDLCQVGVSKLSQLVSQEEAHSRAPTLQLVLFYSMPLSLPPRWKLIFTGSTLNLIVAAQLSLPLLYKSRK